MEKEAQTALLFARTTQKKHAAVVHWRPRLSISFRHLTPGYSCADQPPVRGIVPPLRDICGEKRLDLLTLGIEESGYSSCSCKGFWLGNRQHQGGLECMAVPVTAPGHHGTQARIISNHSQAPRASEQSLQSSG
jgi:hypothetical protein